MNYQEDNTITKRLHKLFTNDSYNEICSIVGEIPNGERMLEQIRCYVTALCLRSDIEKARDELDKVKAACELIAQWHFMVIRTIKKVNMNSRTLFGAR